ncbi:MAG: hypothetical protein AB1796_10265 [Bacillota bacterium]
MSPGRERRVPSESGKNLAMEIAVQVKNIALVMLNLGYLFQKQKIREGKMIICDYIDDMEAELGYVALKEGIYRPAEMPKLTGLEP